MGARTRSYEDFEETALKNPEVRRAFDEMEPAYQLTRLRIMRGLTQQQLAEQVGTTQSSIARLESGMTKPTLSFLERVASALDACVTVTIAPC